MNQSEFTRKLDFDLNTFEIDLEFLTDWYSSIINEIENSKIQSSKIRHPRHIGDHLEDGIKKVFEKMLPKRFEVTKGFAINHLSARSKEQDIIIYDSQSGAPFAKTENTDYLPIELVTASIEIKSNLNLSELRKSILNCVSLKKLNYPDYNISEKKRFPFYAIFAYSSKTKDSSFLKTLNDALYEIPLPLRPNIIYVHNKGLYIPKTDNQLSISYESIIKSDGDFGFIPFGSKKILNAQSLFIFISLIIQHCSNSIQYPNEINHFDYIVKPIDTKLLVQKQFGDDFTPKLTKNPTASFTPDGYLMFTIFSGKCKNCGTESFYIKRPYVKSKQAIKDLLLKNPNYKILEDQVNTCTKCNSNVDIDFEDWNDNVKSYK